jgi:DNA polymerase-3 subunit epsilon
MFSWKDKNQKLLEKALKSTPQGQLKNFLMTPMVPKDTPVEKVDYFVVDFETTGLDYRKDHIISVGFTEIKAGRIQLLKSQHHLVKTDRRLESKNVSIHQITDDEVSTGISVKQMMDLLLQHMAGKVVVAHYKNIEQNFIQNISESMYGHQLPLQLVDTLVIERKRLHKLHKSIHPNQLRLFNLREQYHLPRYNAHNALEDAIATAELLLAQISHRQRHGYQLKLKDILC